MLRLCAMVLAWRMASVRDCRKHDALPGYCVLCLIVFDAKRPNRKALQIRSANQDAMAAIALLSYTFFQANAAATARRRKP